jgi:hypothetical protein
MQIQEEKQEMKFLTAHEVAEQFFQKKIPYTTILKMTRDGILPAIKQGKSYIYLASALQDWAEKNLRKPSWANKQSPRRT